MKIYNIIKSNQPIHKGSIILSILFATLFLYPAGPARAQTPLMFDDSLHYHLFDDANKVQSFLVPTNISYARIRLSAYGADGGVKKNHSNGEGVAKGGRGALMEAWFEIGWGTNQIPPGSEILFIPGEKGDNEISVGVVGAAGGGGTGILYKHPTTNIYTCLLIAGGGAGGYADCCLSVDDGDPGYIYACDGCDADDGILTGYKGTDCHMCFGGGGAVADSRDNTFIVSGLNCFHDCGAKCGYNTVPEECWNGKKGWPGATSFPSSYVRPTGGNGGVSCESGVDGSGGFGFGGGSSSVAKSNSPNEDWNNDCKGATGRRGGGGGASPSAPGSDESKKDGGYSWMNMSMALESPAPLRVGSGSTFDPGDGYVIYKIVNDAPVAVCSDKTITLNANYSASLTAASAAKGSYDLNMPNAITYSISLDGGSPDTILYFDCHDVGTHSASVIVSDGKISDTCNFTLTIISGDVSAPVVSCQDVTVYLDENGFSTNDSLLSQSFLEVTDDCDDSTSISFSGVLPYYTCADVGVSMVTITGTDFSGNQGHCSSTVTVLDTVAPVVHGKDITVYLQNNNSVTLTNPGLLDNGSTDGCGTASYAVEPSTFYCVDAGRSNPVTLYVTDIHGRTGVGTASVTVLDTFPPVVVTKDITVNLGAGGTAGISPSAVIQSLTECSGGITQSVIPNTFDCTDIGPNIVTLTVKDRHGNATVKTAEVTVADGDAPTLTCPTNKVLFSNTADCSRIIGSGDQTDLTNVVPGVPVPYGWYADNCQVVSFVNDRNNAGTLVGAEFPVGTTQVTWTVSDGANNASCTFTIQVTDGQAPALVSCPDPTNINLNADSLTCRGYYNYVLPVFQDDCDDSVTITRIGGFSIEEGFPLGQTVYFFRATDSKGNTSGDACHTFIQVNDVTPPVAQCVDTFVLVMTTFSPTISIQSAALLDGGSFDACGGLNYSLSKQTFGCAEVGSNQVTLTVTDGAGFSNSCQSVVVVDDVPPVFNCKDITVNVQNGPQVITPQSVLLNYDPNNATYCHFNNPPVLSLDRDDFDCADIDTPALVTMTAVDYFGRVSTCHSTVTAIDGGVSSVNCSSVTVKLYEGQSQTIDLSTRFSASDYCGGIVSLTVAQDSITVTCDDYGQTLIPVTATDAHGNTATCNIAVNVNTGYAVHCAEITVELDQDLQAFLPANDIAYFDMPCSNAPGYPGFEITLRRAGPPYTPVGGGVTYTIADTGQTFFYFYEVLNTGDGSRKQCFPIIHVIDNHNPRVNLSVSTHDASEADATVVTLTAIVSAPVSGDQSVDVNISGTGISPGDYMLSSPNIFIPNGDSSGSVTMTILDDGLVEGFETAVISLVNPSDSLTIGTDGPQDVTIADNDTAYVTFIPGADFVDESAGTYTGHLELRVVSVPSGGAVQDAFTIPLTTQDLEAVEPDDYSPATASVLFPAGSGHLSSQPFSVSIVDDHLTEPLENFKVLLDSTGYTGIVLMPFVPEPGCADCTPQDTVGILDNDPAGVTIAESDGSTIVYEGAYADAYEVTLDSRPTASVTVLISHDTQVSTDPDVLVFTPDNWDSAQVVLVTAVDDGVPEGPHSSLITHAASSGDANYNALSVNSVNAMIFECSSFDAVLSGAEVICPGGSAAFTVDINGGSYPYTVMFSADGGGPVQTEDEYLAGADIPVVAFYSSSYSLVSVADAFGCPAQLSGSASIDVVDATPPVALCRDISVQLDDLGERIVDPSEADNGSSDNCNLLYLSLSQAAFGCTDVGQNSVVLTASDFNGNSHSCISIITVQDLVPPVVNCRDLSVDLDATGNITVLADSVGLGSTDACDLDGLVLSKSDFGCNDIGPNAVTLFASDVNGNVSSCAAVITVSDHLVPTAQCLDVTVELDVDGQGTLDVDMVDNNSNDACGIAIRSISRTSFNCSDIGTTSVVLTITDVHGNVSTCNSNVTIVDNVAPVVACNDVTVSLSPGNNVLVSLFQMHGGSFDACGPVTNSIVGTTFNFVEFKCANLGLNNVTIRGTDSHGNIATCISHVTVNDPYLPVALCKNITAQLGLDGFVTITTDDLNNGSSDNCGIVSRALSESTFNCLQIGNTTVTLTITDTQGHTASCNSVVTVSNTLNTPSCGLLTKQIVSTSEAGSPEIGDGSAGNERPMLIGETVTYRLQLEVPEGVTNPVSITDHLDGGLQYVSGSLAFSDNADVGMTYSTAISGGASVGDDIVLTLGKIVNSDSDAGAEYITIEYQAIAMNTSYNQADTLLDNRAELKVSGVIASWSEKRTVIVREPVLLASKAQVKTPGGTTVSTADAGDVYEYVVTLVNTGNAPAFDILVSDKIPVAKVEPVSCCDLSSGISLISSSYDSLTGDWTAILDELAPGDTAYVGITVRVLNKVTPGNSWSSPAAMITYTSLSDTSSLERNGTDGLGGALNDYAVYTNVTSAITVPPINMRLQIEHWSYNPLAGIFNGSYSDATSDPATNFPPYDIDLIMTVGESFNIIATITFPEGHYTGADLQWFSGRASPNDFYFTGEPVNRVVELTGVEIVHMGSNLTGTLPSQSNKNTIDSNGDGDVDGLGYRSGGWDFYNVPDGVTNDNDKLVLRYFCRMDDEDESNGPADDLLAHFNQADQKAGFRLGLYPNNKPSFGNEPKIYFYVAEPSLKVSQVVTATDGAGVISNGNLTGAQVGDQVTLKVTLTNNGLAPAYQTKLSEALAPRYDLISVIPSQGSDSSDLVNNVLSAELGSINPGASATVTVVARILSANKGVKDILTACASYASLSADGPDIRKYSACGSTELTMIEFCPDIAVFTEIRDDQGAVLNSGDAGDTVTLYVNLINNESSISVKQLTLTDIFSSGTLQWMGNASFGGAVPDTFYVQDAQFQAAWGNLAPGDSVQIYIQAVLKSSVYPGQQMINTANVSYGLDCNYLANSGTLTVPPIAIDLQMEYPFFMESPIAEYFGGAYTNSTSDPYTGYSYLNQTNGDKILDVTIGETFNAIATLTFPEGKIDKLRLLSFRASPHNSYFLGEPRDRVVQILNAEIIYTGANLTGVIPNNANMFMEDVAAYGDGDNDWAGFRRNSNSNISWNFTNTPDNITDDDDRIIIRFTLRMDDEDESGGPADQLPGKFNAAESLAGLRLGALPYDFQYIEEAFTFMKIVEPNQIVLQNSVVSTSGAGVIADGNLTGAGYSDQVALQFTILHNGSSTAAYGVHLRASTEPSFTITSIDPGSGIDSSDLEAGLIHIYYDKIIWLSSAGATVHGTTLNAEAGTTDTIIATLTYQSTPTDTFDIRHYQTMDNAVISMADCAFTIAQVSVTDPGCSNGSVAVTIAPANSPDLVFTLIGPDTISNSTGQFIGLASGNYRLSAVTADPPYCQRTWNDIILSSPPDITAPVAICNDVTLSLDSTGNAVVTPDMINNGSYDDCTITLLSLNRTEFTCADTGQFQMISLIVEDAAGNIGNCQANITVIDDTPPTALCKDITVQLDSTGHALANAVDVNDGSSDNCGIPGQCGIVPPGEICISGLVLSQEDFGCEHVGPNPVVLTVNDSHNHSSTCTATVFVEDHVIPDAQCQDITTALNELGSASITAEQINNGSYDACGVLSTQISVSSFDCSSVGSNIVVLSVTDNNGNTNSCAAVVTVEDNIQPTAVCKSLSLELDSNGEATVNPAAADNGSNDACGIASFQLSPAVFNCTHLGTTVAVLTATDNNDNSNTCTTQVTVVDKIIPSITCPDDITVVAEPNECSVSASEVDLSTPTAADNCTVIYPFTNNAPSEYPLGNTIVKWFVNDQSNNKNNCKQKVTIQTSLCAKPIQVLHTDTTENTAKIIWQESLCATNYQLRIRQEISPGVWGSWSIWQNYSGPGLEHLFTNLNAGKFHHYQIKSKCFTSNSTIINGWFSTLTSNSLKKENKNLSDQFTHTEFIDTKPILSNVSEFPFLQLIPNPATHWTHVKIEGFDSEPLRLILMNLNGKLIFDLNLPSGENTVELDLKQLNLNSGVYFIRASDGNRQATKQLIITN